MFGIGMQFSLRELAHGPKIGASAVVPVALTVGATVALANMMD